MIYLSDFELLSFIEDDSPYGDLSTYLQGVKDKEISIEIFTREDLIVACSDDAARIAQLFECSVVNVAKPQTQVKKGESIITLRGEYNNIQKVYRNIQVLLEYSSKIATYTHEMKSSIDAVNKECQLLATRKSFPFAKKFCIKSIMSGGAMPHRIGLSETILFFAHHRIIYESQNKFYEALKDIKYKAVEKKIVVESADFEDAKALMLHGADVLQIEKASPALLKQIIAYKNEHYQNVKILATGGIKKENVQDFALTGVDGIVTSALYSCGMADMGSRIIY